MRPNLSQFKTSFVPKHSTRDMLRTEHADCLFHELHFPSVDPVGMNVKLLSKVGQSSFAPDCGESHFSFESLGIIPAEYN